MTELGIDFLGLLHRQAMVSALSLILHRVNRCLVLAHIEHVVDLLLYVHGDSLDVRWCRGLVYVGDGRVLHVLIVLPAVVNGQGEPVIAGVFWGLTALGGGLAFQLVFRLQAIDGIAQLLLEVA